MKGRIVSFVAAALLTLTAGVIAQTSGFPSRPRFQTVTVIGADGSTVINSDAVTTYRETDAVANEQWWWWRANGGRFCLQTRTDAGAVGNDALCADRTGTVIDSVTLGNTAVISGPSSQKLALYAADAVGDAYIGIFENNGVTRKGYIGYGNSSDDTLHFHNEESGGAIALITNGGLVLINGEQAVSVISARKNAATTRTSTTTSAADPDLTFTLPAGAWELSAFLLFDNVTTTTQGYRYQLNFAGTFDPALVVRCIDSRTSNLAAAVVGVQGMNTDTIVGDSSTSNVDIAEIRCYMRATVGGTLQVRWAQEASSANGTRLNNGSWLNATRVGS